MKKELFKVKSMLSTTAILTMLSVSSYAQEKEISKVERLKSKLVKIDSTLIVNPNLIEKFNIEHDEVEKKKMKATLTRIEKAPQDKMEEKKRKSTLTRIEKAPQDKMEEKKRKATLTRIEKTPQNKVEEKKRKATLTRIRSVDLISEEQKRINSLETYICQKENQLEKLEEKFTSFQKTITESTLAMQTAIAQIAMLNQNNQNQNFQGIYNVPSLTDRYSNLYPMMMMQSMQNQMMIQNMSSNYTQSINQMIKGSMYGYSNMGSNINNFSNLSNIILPKTKGTGQQVDAHTSNHNNLNNVQENFNPSRTLAITKDSKSQEIQPWAQFTKASQDGFKFEATKVNPSTGDKVTETVKTPTNKALTIDEFGSKLN